MTKWVILFLLVGCIYCQQVLDDPTDDVELDLEVEMPADDVNNDEDNYEGDYIAPTPYYEDANGPMVTEHGLSFPSNTDQSKSADEGIKENESRDSLDEQKYEKDFIMQNANRESDIQTSLGDYATETKEEVLGEDILQKSGGAGVEQNAGETSVKQNADGASVDQNADAVDVPQEGNGPYHRPGYGNPHDFYHHGWHHHHGSHGPYGHPKHYGHGSYVFY